MTELEFARIHLGEFKTKGNEIIPKLCPYCHGGQHKDKETFALNMEEHVFKCLRGSCGHQGSFRTLLRDFGEEPMKVYPKSTKRSYKAPKPQKIGIETKEAEYIRLRGIEDSTSKAFGVGCNSKGEVVFPYYETKERFEKNQPTFIKYRPAHKLKKGEPKARREKDTKPILFGMHLCDPEKGKLFIFEGEFDCMVGYQATGYNCVSVPSGCKDFMWIETCADFISQYSEIAIIGDNDEPGQEMMQDLCKKLDSAVFLPDFNLYENCKDANEILFHFGKERIQEIMDTVKIVPVVGVINIADIVPIDITKMKRTLSGVKSLDRMTGGLYMGDLNVWTGKRGDGKSTFLTQCMLEAVDQDYNVCIYSGEIPAERLQYSVYLQAAGTFACEKKDLATEKTVQYVPQKYVNQISQWLDRRIWIYDSRISGSDESDNILNVFEQVYKRYDCRIFLVDNLMTIQSSKKESDFFQAQADLCIRLRNFAKRLNVCVHLVVHPRKTNGKFVSDNDDVSGTSTITNIACNSFSIRKLSKEDAAENGCDSILSCMKNRMHGTLGNVRLNFDNRCKRFVEVGQDMKMFPWNTDFIEIDDVEPPF